VKIMAIKNKIIFCFFNIPFLYFLIKIATEIVIIDKIINIFVEKSLKNPAYNKKIYAKIKTNGIR
jgi:hypothetical protein